MASTQPDLRRDITKLKAGVVGTGFVGVVHVEALRRLGIEVLGVVGSSPERAAAKGIAPVYPSYEALLEDDSVDVVHITTPNYLHHPQVKQALAAGKHVICEKPLALTSEQSAELFELARRSRLVHCTHFNLRFYPQVQQAWVLANSGALGEVWDVHGGYLQDWLLRPTDWNWRLEPDKGGELRAVADVGSHWLDMTQWVIGQRVVAVFADLATSIPVRRRPAGDVETFAGASEAERVDESIRSEDFAHVLVRYERGARGSAVLSQVSAGRKNALRFEINASEGSVQWDQERPDELWLGHRDRANELLLRNPALLDPEAAALTTLPAGHSEGYAETFRELYRAVYADVAYAATGALPRGDSYPTFADGHWANVLGDAIARSSREERWVEVSP